MMLGVLLSQYNFDKYQSDDKEKIEITFNDSLKSESLLLKRNALFWVKDLINTPAFDRSPEYFIEQVEIALKSSPESTFESILIPTEWWFLPVKRQALEGEHRVVVWKSL